MGFRITLHFIHALLIIFSFITFGLTSAQDTVTSTQLITDSNSNTVTSKSGDFRLGFFTPQNSTHRYLGIWYFSQSNILWIANRDQPLNDSSGVFRISQENGNLVLLHGKNLVLWSSNVSTNATTNTTAQLQDSGNFVLSNGDTGETLWQSFDHPCGGAVPKMKITANKFTGQKMKIVSWKTPSDPSSGYFSCSLERLAVPEVFFWENGTHPLWRTGPWNGRIFIGYPQMSTGYLYGWSLVTQEDGTVYLTYNFLDPASSGFLTLTPQGKLKLIRYYNKKEVLTVDIDQTGCDHYGTCGQFGSCNQQNSPICSCLTGFVPKNPEEWKRQNWTSGCVRKSQTKCESGVGQEDDDGFLKLQNVKVPDFSERTGADTENQCGTECLGNCSCLAYAYDAGIGCMYWSRALIDIQEFSNAGIDLYIRLAHSELVNHSQKMKGKTAIIIAISVSIGMIALVASAYLVIQVRRSRRHQSLPKHGENLSPRVNESNPQVKLEELPVYDFEQVAAATDDFHLSKMLGKGGFGPVYKGTLPDGQEVAVKRLSRASGQGLEEFMNEVVVISKLQHRNLVRLLGCCVERDEKMLIYEFMPNKSLDAFLFDPQKRKLLDWRKRFNIIEGIARGLLYLHRDSRLRIIHRDLKASNILLDGEMNPKISDFGLARIFATTEDEVNTRRVVGTYGYMSPEYAMEGMFSERSDVYSFGVLLLEIISGRRNNSYYSEERPLSLVGFAWKLWNEGEIACVVDEEIWNASNEKHILKCIHIGLLCVQEVAKERPSMTNVVMMLISENVHLPPPKQVAFVHKQSLSSSEVSSSSKEAQCNSLNNVTLTAIHGR